MNAHHEGRHKDLRHAVIAAFQTQFGREPEIVVRAPGRVNMLGAHVDYNEGWVLPAATEQAIWLAAGRGDDQVRIKALDFEGAIDSFSIDNLGKRDTADCVTWADYPRGVGWTLLQAGHELAPMQAVFAGDVPVGAGLSSSAAVEVAFLAAWNRLGDLRLDGMTMAQYGQRAENDYIGLASGIMDQFASVHGAEARLVLLDCRTLEHELVPLPESCAILVADSGMRRALASSEYNVRRSQCEEAVSILSAYLPGIRTLRDVSLQSFEGVARHLPVVLRRRARHVIEECQRVLNGAAFLKAGDVQAFGRLIRHSHASARDLYEVSIPELDLLAETAWKVDGCYGARLTGAGFGGCVVILAETKATVRTKRILQEAYASTYARSLHVFETSASQGAQVMDV